MCLTRSEGMRKVCSANLTAHEPLTVDRRAAVAPSRRMGEHGLGHGCSLLEWVRGECAYLFLGAAVGNCGLFGKVFARPSKPACETSLHIRQIPQIDFLPPSFFMPEAAPGASFSEKIDGSLVI